MRDPVQIDELKAAIQDEQAVQKRFRYALYAAGGLTVIGLLFFFSAPEQIVRQYMPQDTEATVAALHASLTGLSIFTIVAALVLAAVYYWYYGHLAARTNQYAPSPVTRLTPMNVLGSLWAFWVFIGVFVIIDISSGVFQAVLLSFSFYGFLIALFLPIGIRYFYRRSIMSAYQGGLAKVEDAIRKRPQNPDLLIMKAALLLEQGQLDAAEGLFRELLHAKLRWGIINASLLLNNLGICLSLQERYDEASANLENAIQINPLFGHAYDSLAMCYLEQDAYPAQALELAQLAQAHTDVKLVDSITIQRATEARAQALLGDATAAEQTLKVIENTVKINPLRPAQMTDIYRQMGYASLALGQAERARGYFMQAIALDPNGLYGKLAKRGLESIPT